MMQFTTMEQPRGESLEIRPLSSHEDFLQCIRMQKDTWGETFSELVPIAILKASARIGGVVAGAFDPEGRMVGFVFGMTGVREGRAVHWSDMLAVRNEARNSGLGRRLKEYQRQAVLQLGVNEIYWTYDPLVAKNAHLNLNRLGARPVEYVPEMYGAETDSELHRGIGTDRFVVCWNLTEPVLHPSTETEQLEPVRDSPILNPLDPAGIPHTRRDVDFALERFVRVQVPADIQRVQHTSSDLAWAWRESSRTGFIASLERGYRVRNFYASSDGGVWYYVLERTGDDA